MTAAYHPESVLKVQKICQNLRKYELLFLKYKCYFFGVQNKINLSAQYKLLPPYGTSFPAFWHKFCRLLTRVLPHYGASFVPYGPVLKKQTAVQKSVAFSRGCRSLS
jgi:hypothetical protein